MKLFVVTLAIKMQVSEDVKTYSMKDQFISNCAQQDSSKHP